MVSWKLSLRAFRSRPGRSILTMLSIVIGVAAVVAVTLGTATTRAALTQMFTTLTGRAGLEVVADGGSSFDQRSVRLFDNVEGVKAAVPVLQRQSIMYLGGRKVQLVILGIDPEKDRMLRDYEIVAGNFFEPGVEGVVLDSSFARSAQIELDQEVKLLTKSGLKKTNVIGFIAPRGAGAIGQGVLFMPMELAQTWFRVGKRIDSVQLLLDPGADEDKVLAAVAEKCPQGISVRRPATRTRLAEETMLSTEHGLELASSFTLMLAIFIILNTFQMNVAERRRQFAIMRAVGATRRQISLLLYREAIFMGVVGSAIGMLAGLGGAALLTRATEQALQIDLPAVTLKVWPFALAGFIGVTIALLGTYLPARRAARLSPLEGMGVVLDKDISGPSRAMTVLGIIVLAGSAAGFVAATAGWLPLARIVDSGIAALLGLVLLLPVVVGPAIRGMTWLMSPLLKTEGRLAQQQMLLQRGRTSLTVGVLFIAMSAGVGIANSIMDNVRDIRAWSRKTIVGDFYVRAMLPNMATGLSADLPETLFQKIRAIPGVTGAEKVRFVSIDIGEQKAIVIIREYLSDESTNFDLQEGDSETIRQRLYDGDIVLGTVLAHRLGLSAGDRLPLKTAEGEKQLQIAGLNREYMAGGLTIYMQRGVAEKLLQIEGADAIAINARDDALAEVEPVLERLCVDNGVLLLSFADLVQVVDGMIAGIVGCLWALLILAFVVAGFGVVNTLTMNVMEQTRELGLLRVVAMTRAQVRKLIFSQAALLAGIGLLPAVGAGLAVAWLMNKATFSVLGRNIQMGFYPLMLIGTLVGAFAIVLAAAWIPAERAARLNLTEALKYE